MVDAGANLNSSRSFGDVGGGGVDDSCKVCDLSSGFQASRANGGTSGPGFPRRPAGSRPIRKFDRCVYRDDSFFCFPVFRAVLAFENLDFAVVSRKFFPVPASQLPDCRRAIFGTRFFF